MKVCSVCGESKDLSLFYKQRKVNGDYAWMSFCKDCHRDKMKARLDGFSEEERAVHYEKMRARNLLRKFDISLEEYEFMFIQQLGVCAICHQPEVAKDPHWTGEETRTRRLSVDHDHATDKVRGLLCMKCNTRLGYFEKYGLMESLLAYLEWEQN